MGNAKTSADLQLGERVVDRVLSAHIHTGKLVVTYPSGQRRTYGKGAKAVHVRVHSLPISRFGNPSLFVGESYMHKNIEIDEDQLDELFRIMSLNEVKSPLLRATQSLPKRQLNRRQFQRRQISHHYDVGNDYYKLWLDKSMTYSCAYFKRPHDSLEKAQQQKTDHVLRKLQLETGQTLLDIGCGWGHLAVAAARKYGVRVLGITLSEEQATAAKKLAEREEVNKLVSFELKNYQDLSSHQQFDRIVSVGMFEHVGRGNHAIYFEKVRELLKDNGVSVLHTITARHEHAASSWIDKYIFPGGYLPTIALIEELLARYNFLSVDRENLWQHYAMTLDIWRQRHRAHREQIIKMFDEPFYRMRDLWLAGSAAAFRYAGTDINQFIFTKHKPKRWPLTREYLYTQK